MNKLSYDEALKQLKQLEVRQRAAKNIISRQGKFQFLVRSRQKVINENKPVINLLLSIIHAHKSARKLYAENYRLKQIVSGISTLKRGSNEKK